MNRQVDIKALVSHIVRGDGADRCRICMGDTTEGQVFLGDTVMLDGDRPVTLAELLETLTGVEVYLDAVLPTYLCPTCAMAAIESANFRTFARESSHQWESSLATLGKFPALSDIPKRNKGIFVIIQDDSLNIINDCTGGLDTAKSAAMRLRNRLTQITFSDHRLEMMRSVKRCACPDCGKEFFYAHHLNLHLNESGDNKRACQHCAEIMTRDELIQHLIHVHNKEPYACTKCSALYKSLEQYERHIIKAHAPSAFTCGDCGRTFRSNQAFNAHLSIHAQKTCPSCGKIFRNQPCFSHHIQECNAESNENEDLDLTRVVVKRKRGRQPSRIGPKGAAIYECYCDYCGKRFSGKKYVKAHIQIVHTKTTHRHCTYCSKYLAAAHMTEHLKKHELIRTYKCTYCGISLKSDLGMKQHLRLHTGEKPYHCKYCGDKFSASSRRSEHVRKMHKMNIVLRHACTLCPARFRLPYRLRNHMMTVHSNTDQKKPEFECSICHEKFGSCRGLLHHSRKHQQIEARINKGVEKTRKEISEFKVYVEEVKMELKEDSDV